MAQGVDKEILDVLPKIKEAKNIVGLMDRDTLTFDVALQRTEDEVGRAGRTRRTHGEKLHRLSP